MFAPTAIDGCFLLSPDLFEDQRGGFAKIFRRSWFLEQGLEADFHEQFFSESGERVLRGMHLQVPPHAHAKVVTCVRGRVLDVVVDLRRASPTFGQHAAFELEGTRFAGVYVPKGLAHGFLALEAPAVMHYATSSEHSPGADCGIRWNSFGFAWPDSSPIISERDSRLPPLSAFDSPF